MPSIPPAPPPPPVPIGLATKSGFGTAILAFGGAVANLAAGGPIEQTVTLFGGGFATILTVLIGRYWQAAKVPPIVSRIASIADRLLEQSQPRVQVGGQSFPASPSTVPSPGVPISEAPTVGTPPPPPVPDRKDRHKKP